MQVAVEDVTRALVLRVVDYGETDRVVTLLTEQLGKGAAFARAARRSQRRFGGGALEPGTLVRAAVGRRASSERGGGMWTLGRAEVLRSAAGLGRDLDALGRAHYALELCNAAVPEHEADAPLFALCEAFVERCAAGQASEAALRRFELALLLALGWAPAWTSCAECGRPWGRTTPVWFWAERGGLLCPEHAPPDRRGAVPLRPDTAAAMGGEADDALAGDGAACARACLDLVWRAHLGRELRSAAVRRVLAS